MRITRLPVVAVLGLLAATLGPGEADGDDAVLLLAGFEKVGRAEVVTTEGSRTESISGHSGLGLRWTPTGDAEESSLAVRTKPTDLRPYGLLRVSLRSPEPVEGVVWFRFWSANGDLRVPLPEAGREWTEVELPLTAMYAVSGFDPAAVLGFQLLASGATAFTLDLDEVRLVRAPGGWNGVEGGEEGFRFVVADFESTAGSRFDVWSGSCGGEVVDSAGGKVLRLSVRGKHGFLGVRFDKVPTDIRPFRFLSLRARLVSGRPTAIRLAVGGRSGSLETVLPGLGPEWQEIRIPLPEMEADETFDPRTVDGIGLYDLSSSNPVIELDDVEVAVDGAGWRYSALERLRRGPHAAAPALTVADFESEDSAGSVLVEGGTARRVKVRRRHGNGTGHALRFEVEDEEKVAHLYLRHVPRDLREFRVLRFLVRADRDLEEEDFQVRLESKSGRWSFTGRASIGCDVVGFSKRWRQVEIDLPEMPELGEFDPGHVVSLHLSRQGPLRVYLDEFRLVKGAGGCRRTEREECRRVFGEKGASRVTELSSEHFRIWTDVEKPDRKLAKRLESRFDAVVRLARLPDLGRPVEVFLVKDRETFADPYLREGKTVHEIEAAAGFARGGSLVACAPDLETPAFDAALARAVVQRAVGSGGGAWLQDGLAGLAAIRSEGGDAADRYRKAVKERHRLPLADLLAMPRLLTGGKGGVPAMAAAFVQFVLEGPPAKRSPDALRRLALLDSDAPRRAEAVEEILGAPLDALQKEWVEWLAAE